MSFLITIIKVIMILALNGIILSGLLGLVMLWANKRQHPIDPDRQLEKRIRTLMDRIDNVKKGCNCDRVVMAYCDQIMDRADNMLYAVQEAPSFPGKKQKTEPNLRKLSEAVRKLEELNYAILMTDSNQISVLSNEIDSLLNAYEDVGKIIAHHNDERAIGYNDIDPQNRQEWEMQEWDE